MFRLFSWRRSPQAETMESVTRHQTADADASPGHEPLLDELESLQAALHTSPGINTSHIPILDDIVESSPDRLDDAGRTKPSTMTSAAKASFQHEILIQEVIDSLMPSIEVELRRRLLKLDQDMLRQWFAEQEQQRN